MVSATGLEPVLSAPRARARGRKRAAGDVLTRAAEELSLAERADASPRELEGVDCSSAESNGRVVVAVPSLDLRAAPEMKSWA